MSETPDPIEQADTAATIGEIKVAYARFRSESYRFRLLGAAGAECAIGAWLQIVLANESVDRDPADPKSRKMKRHEALDIASLAFVHGFSRALFELEQRERQERSKE